MPSVRCPCGQVFDDVPGTVVCPRCHTELYAAAPPSTLRPWPVGLLGLALLPLLIHAVAGVGHAPSPYGEEGSGHIAVRWTGVQWVWGLLSACGFGALLTFMFGLRPAQLKAVLVTALYAAGLALILCLLLQLMTFYPWKPGRSRGAILTYLCQFLGFSYRAGLEEHVGFLRAAVSFFLGMGLLEGVVKATPVLLYLRGHGTLNVRDALVWGLGSGAAVGCIEAISYASTIFPGGSFVIFISSVAVHAVLNGIAALIAWKREADLEVAQKGVEWFFLACVIVAASTALHALYDTFLKRDDPGAAFMVALAAFGTLGVLLQRAGRRERGLRADPA